MKIPRPRRLIPAFRRRSSPPPAARKLLTASLASGLILVVMLAIVFLPRGLTNEELPPLPQVRFELNTTGSTRVVVSSVTVVRPLSEYRAEYVRGDTVLATLAPLADGARNGTFTFRDADRDGNLTVGDEFGVAYNGDEVLRLWYVPQGRIVGYWPPPP